MQNISNILVNILLLYPLLYVAGYCIGDKREEQIGLLYKVAGYLFIVNSVFIKLADLLETYLLFYVLVIIPSGVILSKVAKRCIAYGFNKIGFDRIYSFTSILNEPSINVMKKIGLKEHGRFELPNVDENNPLRPHVLYMIDRKLYNQFA